MKTIDQMAGLPEGSFQQMTDEAIGKLEREAWERRLRIEDFIFRNKEKLQELGICLSEEDFN